MKILLDTHCLLWAFIETRRIGKPATRELLSDTNEVYYSQASLWEISIKYRLGKLLLGGLTPEDFYREVENSFMKCRELRNAELVSFHRLPIDHRDPFDRIMIWQAITSGFHFLSADRGVREYVKFGLLLLEP